MLRQLPLAPYLEPRSGEAAIEIETDGAPLARAVWRRRSGGSTLQWRRTAKPRSCFQMGLSMPHLQMRGGAQV